MNDKVFKCLMYGIALAFSIVFLVVVVPPLVANPDIIGALAAGFVNPYASGYSTDVLLCWLALAIWVVYESKTLSIKHGWVCVLLGIAPGVAVGFPLYLVLRSEQLKILNKK